MTQRGIGVTGVHAGRVWRGMKRYRGIHSGTRRCMWVSVCAGAVDVVIVHEPGMVKDS